MAHPIRESSPRVVVDRSDQRERRQRSEDPASESLRSDADGPIEVERERSSTSRTGIHRVNIGRVDEGRRGHQIPSRTHLRIFERAGDVVGLQSPHQPEIAE